MNTTLKLKLALLVSIIFFAGMVLTPSFYPGVPDWWSKYLSPGKLKLGLDLQGGMHLILRVDLEKAAENSLDLAASDLKYALSDENITAVRLRSDDPHLAIFTLPNTGAVATVNTIIKNYFANLDIIVEADPGVFPKITIKLTQAGIDFIHDNAVDQSVEIIRNRIDQFGVTDPVIIRQGERNIIVQLPGIKDPVRALALIGQTAQLGFKLVADDAGLDLNQLIDKAVMAGQWQEGDNRKQLSMALRPLLPENTEIYFQTITDHQTGKVTRTPLLLYNQLLMTGEMVKDARVRIGGTFNEPFVSLDLTSRGGKVFAKVTEKNVNRRLAIVLDEVVRSAPVIRERILGGSAQISGQFTTEEAADLAIVLRVGALPAPVDIIQNLTVGASLGQDSINRGLISGIFGAFMVLVFMAIYYRLSGIIANFALTLNIFLLFTGLAMLSATLTLPGIAGIILAIGMAVDANVLIFERIREEFALGKSVKSGVDAGFNKAFLSIVDSQVTTLITALALFLFGTGPIQGFAITLSLGIIFNLFAVLFCSRMIYETLYSTRKLKKLKFMRFIKKTNFDFMRVRKFTFMCSAVMVVIGMFAFVDILRGGANMGVDFAGGSLLQYKTDKPFELEHIRASLTKHGFPGLDLQEVTSEHRLIVKMKKSEETVAHLADEITIILSENHPDKHFILESTYEIGSSVSEVLRNRAIQAIAIALLGVLCYLAIRFDFSFGLAAAAATFHDVLIVLAICWLLNIEINLLLVTALLTLAGYSLNDSVVVFDRIRENIYKMKGADFFTIINASINQILSRSIVTSLTTCMVLLSLFIFGGSAIHDFSFALLIGVLVGTYSSIFIASPLLALKDRSRDEQQVKEVVISGSRYNV